MTEQQKSSNKPEIELEFTTTSETRPLQDKRIGRKRQTKNQAKKHHELMNFERQRKLALQLERASQRKPKKMDRVKPNNVVRNSLPQKSPNDAFKEVIDKLENRILELKGDVANEAEMTKLEMEADELQSRMREWASVYEECMRTQGSSINMGFHQFNKTDIRSFVQTDIDTHMKNLTNEMKKRFYENVLRESVNIGGKRSRIKNPDEPSRRQAKKHQRDLADQLQSSPECEFCKKPAVIFTPRTASYSCTACGLVNTRTFFNMDNIGFVDKDQYTKVTLPYDPLSHFKEFLSRLQATERTQIPPVVIESVKKRCRMNRVDYANDPSSLTYLKCRTYLQQEGYANRFENICSIIYEITGVRPVTLSDVQIRHLTSMFIEVTKSYSKVKKERRNLLSYSYQVYKYCQLLGIDQALPFLPLFKDDVNLSRADKLWKELCQILGYEYIETV